ncbi:MAG: cytochrome c [Planctomycetes bacterium]|nr:cytochrome c [Planctomycetota bacterium]
MTPRRIQAFLASWTPRFSPRLFRSVLIGLLVASIAIPLALVAVPYLEIFNDMAVQPKARPQSLFGYPDGRSLIVERAPAPGSIPMDHFPYTAEESGEQAEQLAGERLRSPLRPTISVLQQGRKLYNTFCTPCHGAEGQGDGGVAELFGAPPSLHTGAARALEDGRIFHVISRGRNTMPSYEDLLAVEERWRIVHYVRALQRALHPQDEDFER